MRIDPNLLAFESFQPSDADSYHVVVSNAYGTLASASMRLTVVLPPLISTQPHPVIVPQSSNATFTAQTSGTGPFTSQWAFQGAFIMGATNSSLTLSNLVRSNEGNFSVVVCNLAGSVTSSPALLRVLVPQRLRPPIPLPEGRLRLQFGDEDGAVLTASEVANFEVHVSTNLFTSNWFRLTNDLSLSNGMLVVEEADAADSRGRFYRLLERYARPARRGFLEFARLLATTAPIL